MAKKNDATNLMELLLRCMGEADPIRLKGVISNIAIERHGIPIIRPSALKIPLAILPLPNVGQQQRRHSRSAPAVEAFLFPKRTPGTGGGFARQHLALAYNRWVCRLGAGFDPTPIRRCI